jgi:hypothetical protein
MTEALLLKLVYWAGIGHFVLCLASLAVPKALQWRENLKKLQPLLRQMFWTYAGYILAINGWFGIISVWGTRELLAHTILAKSLTLLIALYWLTRIGIQFLYFDRSQAPKGLLYTLGEIALVSMFINFTVIYFLAFLHNLA